MRVRFLFIIFFGTNLFVLAAEELIAPLGTQYLKLQTFRGQVIDENEEPIAGAQIIARTGSGRSSKVPPYSLAVSDKGGNFEVSCNAPNEGFNFQRLWAYRKGYNIRCVTPHDDQNKIILLPQEGWQVQVKAPDGTPAAGVTVKPYYFEIPNGVYSSDVPTGLSSSIPIEIQEFVAAETDQFGRAALKGLPRKLVDSVQVSHPKYGTQISKNRDLVELQPAGSISGRIVCDPMEIPVGTTVWFTSTVGNEHTSRAAVTVEERGTFHVNALGAGFVKTQIQWNGDSNVRPIMPARFQFAGEENVRVEIRTEPVSVFRQQFLTAETRRPIVNARVSIRDESGPTQFYTTDEDGWINAKALAGAISIRLRTLQEEDEEDYNHPFNKSVTLAPDNELIVLKPILVPELKSFSGKLLNPDGTPVRQRVIALSELSSNHLSNFPVAMAVTDDEGSFELKVSQDHAEELQRRIDLKLFPGTILNWEVFPESITSKSEGMKYVRDKAENRSTTPATVSQFDPLILKIQQ